MNLKRSFHTDTPGREDGFTFIEVLAAIAIMSFSAFVIWNGVSGALKTSEKILIKSRVTSELALFEYNFRKSVNRIKTPYWEKEISSDGLTGLKAELEDYPYKNIHLNSFFPSDKGVTVILTTVVDREVELKANFGSFILKGDL